MYKKIGLFFSFFSLHLFLLIGEVTIETTVSPSNQSFESPLSVTITITYPTAFSINENSFLLNKTHLDVDKVKKVVISPGTSGTSVAFYQFELPSKPPGIYTLDKIYVEIDGELYHSEEIRYEVQSPKREIGSTSTLILKLETEVEKPEPFYPGQTARLIYRIFFNQNIELTASHFPLLDANGFKKIGEKQIKEARDGDLSVQEISQTVEAVNPGSYAFDAAYIQGYAYREEVTLKKVYMGKKQTSESPGITIVVSPLPKKGKPLSYVGVIGDLDMRLSLLTPSKIVLGNPIKIRMEISSKTDLEGLEFPKLDCQPGFSGFFSIEKVERENVTKKSQTFSVVIKPLTTFVKAIPSIEIASFDPQSNSYLIWQSEPIPISVKKNAEKPTSSIAVETNESLVLETLSTRFRERLAGPIKMDVLPTINHSELLLPIYEQERVLYLLPLASSLLLLQIIASVRLVDFFKTRKLKTPAYWLKKGLNQKNPTKAAGYLKLALENLPLDSDTKLLIEKLDEIQYGQASVENIENLKIKCKNKFNHLI